MRRIPSCITASIAGLSIGTLFLLSTTSKITFQNDDAIMFLPPHPQISRRNSTTTTEDASLLENSETDGMTRRNLSESESTLNSSSSVVRVEEKETQYPPLSLELLQRQQQQQPAEPETTSDNRPSGVVYQYISPPPINMTARSLLSTKFRHLADLSTTSTSTALCGIVKDAEPYLDEWIDYHFGLGVHTIYLIDNSKHHELKSWQDKRRAAGHSVRVLPKPGSHRQMYGYHMCAAEFKDAHTYMAFFDVDEFLVLKNHSTIDAMLKDHLQKGSLAISWYIFGSGGTSLYAPLPVTMRFLYRDGHSEADRHDVWHNVKSIVKLSDYGGYPKSPHSIKTNKRTAGSDKAWVDTNGKGKFDDIGASNFDRPVDIAVLHHYKFLSPKEFYWKSCIRKTVDDKLKDCDDKLKRGVSHFVGSVYDDSAWQTLKRNVPQYAMYDQFNDFM